MRFFHIRRRYLLSLLSIVGIASLLGVGMAMVPAALAATETIWGNVVPATQGADSVRYELGTIFSVNQPGTVTAVRLYATTGESGTHTARIWNNATGARVGGPYTFTAKGAGWRTYNLPTPVTLTAGTSYTVSITTGGDSKRAYAYKEYALTAPGSNGQHISYPANAGVFTTTLGTRPTSSYRSSNYYRDIVFSPASAPAPTPTATLNASPTNIISGQSATLAWSSTNATSCTGNGFSTNSQVSGSVSVTPVTTTTYSISCAGAGGTASSSAIVTVIPALIASASANPATGTVPLAVSFTGTATGGTGAYSYSWYFGDGQTASVQNPSHTYSTAGTYSVVLTVTSGSQSAQSIATVTVSEPTATITTLWPESATPANVTTNDTNAVELGVKFRPSVNGSILGIRFYKGPMNTGTHTGSLWSTSGTRLATATFSNETSSGWQEVRFDSPVSVTAGTLYVASYHTAGYYSNDSDYFLNDYVNGNLTAPSSGAVGGNGVYAYGASSVFPSETYFMTNYWVDVVFQPGVFVPDTQAPTMPANPVAVPMSSSQINFAWTASTDNVGVAGYNIFRNGTQVAVSTSPGYHDTGLMPNTTYGYSVSAFDGAGNVSASSAVATATTYPASTNCNIALGEGADLGGARPFPADNEWNRDISNDPLDPNSANMIASWGPTAGLHPDFGSGLYGGTKIGLPYIVVPEDQPLVPTLWNVYGSQADPGPYPIPNNAPIEGFGGTGEYYDRHVLVVQRDCSKPSGIGHLYELFQARPIGNYPVSVDRWEGYGAKFDANTNALRPEGWTSADAAGLPIFPGLVRYDEVQRAIQDFNNGGPGVIPHAIRFTLAPGYTRTAYLHPATHAAGYSNSPNLAPMGVRIRLKANVPTTGYSPEVQAILRTMKKYGMILADNGGNWFIGGAPDERWNNDELRYFGYVHGSDFEVVKMGTLYPQQ